MRVNLAVVIPLVSTSTLSNFQLFPLLTFPNFQTFKLWTQVLAIQNAKKQGVEYFQFPGDPQNVLLKPVCGFFITMNPGMHLCLDDWVLEEWIQSLQQPPASDTSLCRCDPHTNIPIVMTLFHLSPLLCVSLCIM